MAKSPQNDFARIFNLCNLLQNYDDEARRWRDARQVKHEAIQADRERQISGDELRRAVAMFDVVEKSIQSEVEWLSECHHLLVMHSLIGLIPSLDESRRTHIYPHHIAGFDWQAFSKELVAVRDAAQRATQPKLSQAEWSVGRSPSDWLKIFDKLNADCRSLSVFNRRRKNGTYRQHPDSTIRSVRLALDNLPSGYSDSMTV